MQPFKEKLGPLFITGDMATNRVSALDEHFDETLGCLASPLKPTASWFDVRVLYLRVSSCPCSKVPESLSMKYPPRCISTALEVNGGRVAPSEEAIVVLRRDRVDTESKEVTYVSTENLRISGNVSFEIYHKGDLLLCGTLNHSSSSTNLLVHDDESESSGGTSQLGWNMDCTCSIESLGCVFLKAKDDFKLGSPPPSMEVCLVGHYCGQPVILDQSVNLTVKRRSMRRRLSNLNVILEEDDNAKAAAEEPLPPTRTSLRDADENTLHAALPDRGFEQLDHYRAAEEKAIERLESYYAAGTASDADDAELSWFNAGVRIGVGVGMGMCVGVGLGVGLLVRTYQATSKSFKRGLC